VGAPQRGSDLGRHDEKSEAIVEVLPWVCADYPFIHAAVGDEGQVDALRATHVWRVEQRARTLAQLNQDGQRNLVIVRYRPEHSPDQDWVNNEATSTARRWCGPERWMQTRI